MVEVVGLEPTSRQSLKKLSTRLVKLGFSNHGRCKTNRIVTLSTVSFLAVGKLPAFSQPDLIVLTSQTYGLGKRGAKAA